jgi:hypothetical protein
LERPLGSSRWPHSQLTQACGKEAHQDEPIESEAFLLVAVMTALVLLPASALAAQPVERFHDNFTDTFSDVLCDIPVDVVAVGVDNFFLYADDSFKDTASVRATVTNPANGKSVIISNAGQVTGTALADEAAGRHSAVTATGLGWQPAGSPPTGPKPSGAYALAEQLGPPGHRCARPSPATASACQRATRTSAIRHGRLLVITATLATAVVLLLMAGVGRPV